MRVSIIVALLAIALVSAHHEHEQEHKPLITREHIAELKKVAPFEVHDYESHPFKDWSQVDFQQRLGLLFHENAPKKEIFYGVEDDTLPKAFHYKDKWPQCFHPIRDQQRCGSCWAFAASEVLSDRFCIASNGNVNEVLSPQDLVSCDKSDYGCSGGYLDHSWEYIKDNGIVTDSCLPYTSGNGDSGKCPTSKTCKDGKAYKKYRVTSYKQYSTIVEAKTAIYNEGPIEAAFMVYQDFMSYKGGVYKHKTGGLLGGHAVKIVGWGVDDTDGTEYWVVANSWNTVWGEQGFFRIAFGECQFEQQLYAGQPDLHQGDFFLH